MATKPDPGGPTLPFPPVESAKPPPQAPAPHAGARERPLTVEALLRVTNILLEEKIGQVWVEGEISNLKVHSGHHYFALKDGAAQVAAVMWRSSAQRLRFRLEEGKRFLVRGRPSIYPEQGKFQLYVDLIEPAGLGAAALALEQLRARLAAEGLFAAERKRPLPRIPRRVGVVTSPTGAAVRDVIRVIERRRPTPILIAPARVQGEGAALEIAGAIARVARAGVDVVIVGRGGGSAEDLSAFNDEAVVRAIAACPVPVVSAVGHEVDVTLADLAADVRAATPTAAGEIAVPETTALAEELAALERRLVREARHGLAAFRARLAQLAVRATDPRRRLDRERQRVDDALARMLRVVRARLAAGRAALAAADRRVAAQDPRARLERDKRALAALEARVHLAMSKTMARARRALERDAGRLDAMSPLGVLERGYAIARRPGGHVVTSARDVRAGDELAVRVADGEIDARVTGTRDQDRNRNGPGSEPGSENDE